MTREQLKSAIFNNVFWFVASMVLAVLVWFVAKIEANPVAQETYENIPINVLIDEGMIISAQTSTVADVDVTAQNTVIMALEADDISLTIDLRGAQPGQHNEDILIDIARPASADTRPVRIGVTLEQEIAQQVPVTINVIPPPINYAADTAEQDIVQAQVSGAANAVTRVSQVIGEIDLSNQQSAQIVERTVTLTAIDADGNRVDDVAIDPPNIAVSVTVTQREDVATLTIRPNILFNTLPDNFEFRDVDYDPETITISGSPEVLSTLGDTIDTETISLAGRTGSFTVEVLPQLPDDSNLLVLSESTITVTITLSEETMTLPLEGIPIRVFGEQEGLDVQPINPQSITVVLEGPVSLLNDLEASDIQAVIDVNNLVAGQYTLRPQIDIRQGQVNLDESDITLLPAEVTVTITAVLPEATQAVEITPEVTPDPETTPERDDD